MNALELIKKGSSELKQKKIASFRLDSEILLSKVLNKRREEILINLNQKICAKHESKYSDLIKRRSNNEPVAYICEEKEFWSKNFFVNNNTLIPRPETELMVEKLVKIFKDKRISILDIGTGSGCILISLLSELKNSKGVGIDISKNAVLIHSVADSKQNNGGEIGWLNEESLNPKIKDKVKKLNIGEHSDLISIPGGYLIIRVDKIEKIKKNQSNIDNEINKIVLNKTNEQLNNFSNMYYNKIKNEFSINEK